jgi:hypothetical protein
MHLIDAGFKIVQKEDRLPDEVLFNCTSGKCRFSTGADRIPLAMQNIRI